MTLQLVKKKICTIAINCTESDENGEMQVEMNYEGDPCVAALLLQDALRFFHDKMEEENLDDGSTFENAK